MKGGWKMAFRHRVRCMAQFPIRVGAKQKFLTQAEIGVMVHSSMELHRN